MKREEREMIETQEPAWSRRARHRVVVVVGAGEGSSDLRSRLTLSELYERLVEDGHTCVVVGDLDWPRIERALVSMHSFHPSFSDRRKELFLGGVPAPEPNEGLPLRRIDAGLTIAEEELYKAVLASLPLDKLHVLSDGAGMAEMASALAVAHRAGSISCLIDRPSIDKLAAEFIPRLREIGQRSGWDLWVVVEAAQIDPVSDVWDAADLVLIPRPWETPPQTLRIDVLKSPNPRSRSEVRRVHEFSGRLLRPRSRPYEDSLRESLRDPLEAAAYLQAALEDAGAEDGPQLVRMALEEIGRSHGWHKEFSVESKKDAEAAEAALSRYYREPVLPASRYCAALESWARCVEIDNGLRQAPEGYTPPKQAQGSGYAADLGRIFRDIRKSNLLYRLIYKGEVLRTRPCPQHKGRWGGVRAEACPHGCSDGHNITGWLPPEKEGP